MADAVVRVVDEITQVTVYGSDLLRPFLAAADADAAAAHADRLLTDTALASALGSQIAAASSADRAATDAAATAGDRAAAEAAIAGWGSGTGLTVPAATRGAMAGLSPVAAAFLYEAGREGPFVFDPSDLSASVTADPGQGLFVPPASDPTGASGAWVRATDHLTPEMFGATGVADDTDALRRLFYMACATKLPVRGKSWVVQNGKVIVGALDLITAPAVDFADDVRIEGLRVKIAAGLASADGEILFTDCKGVVAEDIEYDLSDATIGSGQLRFETVDGFHVRNVRKTHDVDLGSAGGSSAVSIHSCTNFIVDGVTVRNAGDTSAGVFVVIASDGQVRNVECENGQEAVDLSGCRAIDVLGVSGVGVNEVLDVGNCQDCSFRSIRGKDVATGIELKTEPSADPELDIGSNGNLFEDVFIDGFTDQGVVYSAGATASQTLHRNVFRDVRLVTTAATAATRGFRFAPGDNLADPTRGTVLDNVEIEMNAGIAFEDRWQQEYVFRNVRASGGCGFYSFTGTITDDTNGLWQDIRFTGTGAWNPQHRKATLRGIHLSGGATLEPGNGIGNTYEDIVIEDAAGTAFDVRFDNATVGTADKAVTIRGYTNINNSKTTAGGYALKIRHTATSGAIENVHVSDVHIIDDQAVPTSGGVQFGNATFDWCSLVNATARATVTDFDFGFLGLHSHNKANRLGEPVISSSAAFLSLNRANWGRHILYDQASTCTLPAAAPQSTAWSAGSATKLTNVSAGAQNLVAAGGVTITGPTVIPAGKTATITQGAAANTYIVELSA